MRVRVSAALFISKGSPTSPALLALSETNPDARLLLSARATGSTRLDWRGEDAMKASPQIIDVVLATMSSDACRCDVPFSESARGMPVCAMEALALGAGDHVQMDAGRSCDGIEGLVLRDAHVDRPRRNAPRFP
jgi:hypothetical protein